MSIRFGGLVVLAALLAQSPPPMFSPWYVESLRDVLKLEAPDIARLERDLAAKPDDFRARLKLMAYHARADRASREEDRARRFLYALWLIEHHPESEILHSYVSHFSRRELTDTQYQRATVLWRAAAEAKPHDAAVQWNAASFVEGLDAGLYMRYLEATAAADPDHPFALRPLAHLYALSILEGGPLASRAQAGLEASRNVWVLGNAANMFQSQYNQGLQNGRADPRAAELAERYYLRAKALDPKLDRRSILPQPKPPTVPPALLVAANVQRLPVDAFPQLPPAVAGVLRSRNCTVPQPAGGGVRRNVIRGEFFRKRVTGWAVLCSVKNSTALLVFRNGDDSKPDTVTTSENESYIQDVGNGDPGYSREITAVGRDFIMQHYRAYGGPEPPPIDHHGIDDAFIGKASVTWYFYKGKWLRLQGSD